MGLFLVASSWLFIGAAGVKCIHVYSKNASGIKVFTVKGRGPFTLDSGLPVSHPER